MTHLETHWGQLVIQRNGKLIVQLDCCACDDGIDPIRVADFRIEIAPIDDVEHILNDRCNILLDAGYGDVDAETLRRIRAHCSNEHTDTVKESYEEGKFDFHLNHSLGISKESCFNQVEILHDGQIQVRLQKCLLKDGVLISQPKYHRTVLTPLMSDISIHMDWVSTHLVSMGEGPVVVTDIGRIDSIASVENTPLCVAKFKVKHWRNNLEAYPEGVEKTTEARLNAQTNLDSANLILANLEG